MKKGKLIRFGVSLDQLLLKQFDELIGKKGYSNRSEAIRDLIRDRLVSNEWMVKEVKTVGVLSLVYEHETRELTEKLNRIQHDHLGLIVSATHIHIDHHNCLEVIIFRGNGSEIQNVANKLLSTKGVKYGHLTPATTGRQIS